MMGAGNPQRGLFYNISLETFVPEEYPLRRIRPLIDERAIRRACGVAIRWISAGIITF